MPHNTYGSSSPFHKNPFHTSPFDDTDADFSEHRHRSSGIVIDDPDACVDGKTLTKWTEQFYRWAVPSPGGDHSAFYDPTGSVAAQLNHGCGPMYFITQQAGGPPSASRTFDVPLGKAVLVGVAGAADSEGPGIEPTIKDFKGSYADEVKTVLDRYEFTNGSYQLDGRTVGRLEVTNSGIFNAGYAPAGSAGAEFFGAPNGAQLKTTGEKGFWVVLDHLSPGQHTFKASGTVSYQQQPAKNFSVTDIINVVRSF